MPRVALPRDEAAPALGISLDSFERHVQPEVRLIRRGQMRVVPVEELPRWADSAADGCAPIEGRRWHDEKHPHRTSAPR